MEYAAIVGVLQQVQNHNSREWYRQQKAVFQEVHQTLTNLYFSVADQIRQTTAIDVAPRKNVSRPYNDQRFGNKPYLKDSLWVTFRSEEIAAPAFFVEFSPWGARLGMGYYSATPAQMRDLRAKIDADPQGFANILESVLADQKIQVMGASYKKAFATPHQGWVKTIYNYKSVYFQRIVPCEEMERIEQIAVQTFLQLTPLYQKFVQRDAKQA